MPSAIAYVPVVEFPSPGMEGPVMRGVSALALSAVLVLPAMASGMTLDDLTPGRTVSGPNLSVADMKGKVVLVMFWGTR